MMNYRRVNKPSMEDGICARCLYFWPGVCLGDGKTRQTHPSEIMPDWFEGSCFPVMSRLYALTFYFFHQLAWKMVIFHSNPESWFIVVPTRFYSHRIIYGSGMTWNIEPAIVVPVRLRNDGGRGKMPRKALRVISYIDSIETWRPMKQNQKSLNGVDLVNVGLNKLWLNAVLVFSGKADFPAIFSEEDLLSITSQNTFERRFTKYYFKNTRFLGV